MSKLTPLFSRASDEWQIPLELFRECSMKFVILKLEDLDGTVYLNTASRGVRDPAALAVALDLILRAAEGRQEQRREPADDPTRVSA